MRSIRDYYYMPYPEAQKQSACDCQYWADQLRHFVCVFVFFLQKLPKYVYCAVIHIAN